MQSHALPLGYGAVVRTDSFHSASRASRKASYPLLRSSSTKQSRRFVLFGCWVLLNGHAPFRRRASAPSPYPLPRSSSTKQSYGFVLFGKVETRLWNGKSVFRRWSGRRDSNSLPPPWQGGALPNELRPQTGASGRSRTNDTRIFSPLLYQLSYRGISCKTKWWEQQGSNL